MAFVAENNVLEFKQCINKSTYFDTFNETDKILRFCDNKDCKMDYLSSIRILNKKEYDYLYSIIQEINAVVFNYIVFKQIPWKIVVCHDRESQFPHTHGGFIVLPDIIFDKHEYINMMKVLIHEKVHVYQRLYPCHTNILFTRFWGFNIKSVCDYSDTRRSNPDINKLIYIDDNGNKFDNDYVEIKRLGEIKDKRDHPNEMMAYIIQDYFMKNIHENHIYMDGMQSWLQLCFF